MSSDAVNESLSIPNLANDISSADLLAARPTPLGQLQYLWNGQKTPANLKTEFWAGWTAAYFYARFECSYQDLNLTAIPQTSQKTMGLWDLDVVEVFIAPADINHYFEVEVSPLQEWLDVELHVKGNKREANWDWHSKVQASCTIDDANHSRTWRAAFRIPNATLFGSELKQGSECFGNFYRCDGSEPDRRYLTWQPTMTAEPNFHVPEKFGPIRFVDDVRISL